MKRLWLLFAQTITVVLAIYMVLQAMRPEWLHRSTPRLEGVTPSSAVPVLQAPASGAGGAAMGSYRNAAGKAMPAVVNILTTKALPQNHPLMRDPFFRRFFGDRSERAPRSEQQASLGSGVIVSPEGYILTNNHVVEAADEIEVVLADGRKAAAKVVGTDPETDLAVIRIAERGLPVMVLGSSEQARVGDVEDRKSVV